MIALYCENCGSKFEELQRFCSECGHYRYYNGVEGLDASLREALIRDGKLRSKYNNCLVQVSSHLGSCPVCKRFERMVLIDDVFTNVKIDFAGIDYPLLSNAMKFGLFHFGCRHGLCTYVPGTDEIIGGDK